jgi:L-asparaginase / beta-aspartyl-peptidase
VIDEAPKMLPSTLIWRRRAAARVTPRQARQINTAAPKLPAIAVHGGAWNIPDKLKEASVAGVAEAARAGWACLSSGGSSLDAVEAAVRVLEADPAFDAGRGAVLNAAGQVELDAVIMDGRNLAAGAVAAIGPVLHPVSVARLVMERTPHVLLVGPGATAFAMEQGFELLPVEALVTEEALAEYVQMAAYDTAVAQNFNRHELRQPPPRPKATHPGHDTVGAVAIDAHGNVAAATSTGGITFKRVGRVGDSPIIGSGCLADNASGAISITGHGESIMRYTLASRVLQHVEFGAMVPEAACAAGLRGMFERVGGCGGIICVDRHGRLGLAFTTPRMAWAIRHATSDGVRCGIDRRAAASGLEEAEGAVEVVEFDQGEVWGLGPETAH